MSYPASGRSVKFPKQPPGELYRYRAFAPVLVADLETPTPHTLYSTLWRLNLIGQNFSLSHEVIIRVWWWEQEIMMTNNARDRSEAPCSSHSPSLQLSIPPDSTTPPGPTDDTQVTQNQKDLAPAGNSLPDKSLLSKVERVLLIYLTKMRAGWNPSTVHYWVKLIFLFKQKFWRTLGRGGVLENILLIWHLTAKKFGGFHEHEAPCAISYIRNSVIHWNKKCNFLLISFQD